MTPAQRKNFDRLLSPRHIAFIGGTDAIVAIGEARRRGFGGEYWAVNPKRETLAGLTCFTSIDDLPEAPDAVFLAIPAAPAVEAITQLADMGAGGIVCYS
ncbi:MAG: CoA-binding protein, partial [Amylibacter sp.]|nr:CoA-binding protein [Amylibacter sp.]